MSSSSAAGWRARPAARPSGAARYIALNTDVLFAFDKADLTPSAQAELRRVADRLIAEATRTVQIVGHTDDVGSDAYNLGLSRRRAQAVHQALTRLLAGKQVDLRATGKGESQPAVNGTSPKDRARNRRVEVSFERIVTPPPTTSSPPSTPAPTAPGPGRPRERDGDTELGSCGPAGRTRQVDEREVTRPQPGFATRYGVTVPPSLTAVQRERRTIVHARLNGVRGMPWTSLPSEGDTVCATSSA